MGLFSKKKNRAQDQTPNRPKTLDSYSGLPVRVLAPSGAYLFTATFNAATDNAAHLILLSRPHEAQMRVLATQPFQAYLRGYHKQQHKVFRMTGTLSRLADGSWFLTQITYADRGNERENYRQKTDFPGNVQFLERKLPNADCRIADLSSGGACLKLAGPTHNGELLRLSSPVFDLVGVKPISCRVCYNAYDSQKRLILCGCRFVDMDVSQQEALAKLMLKIQIKGDSYL